MSGYALTTGGIILPEQMARSIMTEQLFGNHGAYRSARYDNKSTKGWVTSDGSADADTLADVQTLRQQSSDLIRNDALASGSINVVVTAVVGTCIVPQSRLDYEFVGLTEELASEWQSMAERIFSHWANSKAADSAMRLNYWRMVEVFERSKLERGDVFAIRRFIGRKGSLLKTCWQIIEADRVATPPSLAAMADKNIRGGVELGRNGEPVRYHVLQVHPGEKSRSISDPEDFTAIPSTDSNGDPVVLHFMSTKRVGQTRGIPYLAPVIESLKQLGRYSEAEIAAAVISSMFAVFVKSPAAGTASSPLASFGGALPGQVGVSSPSPQQVAAKQEIKLQSGMIVDLAEGEEIQVAEASRPNTAFEPFVSAILSQIGSALEVPYEVLTRHFSSSYSASRAALLEAWRFFLKEREELIESFCQPVWNAVISEAVATGLLDAPDFFTDPLKREAYLAVDWIGGNVPSLDPLKEATAAKAWHDLGIDSLQDISASKNKDYDRTHKQLVREKRMRDRDGLNVELLNPYNEAVKQQAANEKKDNQSDSNDTESDKIDTKNDN